MIVSCSQIGHRRKMIWSQSSAQQAASRSSGTDTGTKRIVTSHGFRFLLRSAKMLAGSGAPPPEEIQLKENITSYCKPRSRGPAYWPLISANARIEPGLCFRARIHYKTPQKQYNPNESDPKKEIPV